MSLIMRFYIISLPVNPLLMLFYSVFIGQASGKVKPSSVNTVRQGRA